MVAGTSKPLVVVTGPHKKLRFGWWATRLMLRICGLRGHYITPQRPRIPDNVRGVIIGGGDDVNPSHYGLTGDAGARYDQQRDALELEIVACAFKCELPILGICRGAQLMNIALGGNLHQDLRPLREKTPNRNTIFPVKLALFEPSSQLGAIVGHDSIRVNSLHNQAVKDIAEPMRQAATDLDDFVQAIENPQRDFMIGVQWHPEYMPYSAPQRKLFRAFSSAVKSSHKILQCHAEENQL